MPRGRPYLKLRASILTPCARSAEARTAPRMKPGPTERRDVDVGATRVSGVANENRSVDSPCAGIAGAFFASLVQFIEPAPFHFSWSLMMLLAVIVGGSGKFLGPVLGTVIIVLLPEWLRFMQNWYLAVFGFAVVALMIWLPGGLLSIPDKFKVKGSPR